MEKWTLFPTCGIRSLKHNMYLDQKKNRDCRRRFCTHGQRKKATCDFFDEDKTNEEDFDFYDLVLL